MKSTGVFATKEDLEKLLQLARQGWQPGERMFGFSSKALIEKGHKTADAQVVCHELALKYGLPEIPGRYGIKEDGEFVTT